MEGLEKQTDWTYLLVDSCFVENYQTNVEAVTTRILVNERFLSVVTFQRRSVPYRQCTRLAIFSQ